MRFWLLRAAIPLATIGGLFWPTVLTYTFLAGERATAQVAECHRGASRSPLRCTGTWRTASGDTGSGGIYGLSRSDAGHTVEVRVGPLGPYRPGPRAAALPVSLSLFWLVSFGALTVQQVRAGKRTRRLLAEPGAPGDLLIVTGKGAHTPDGRRSASVVTLPQPVPAAPDRHRQALEAPPTTAPRLFTAAGQLVTTGRRRILRLARHWPWTGHITAALDRLTQLPDPG